MPIKEFVKRVIDAEWVARVIEVLDRRSDNRMTELGMLGQAFEFAKINQVPGDYLEFGLWRGKTFSYAYRMMHRYRRGDMKLWGFDSFRDCPKLGIIPTISGTKASLPARDQSSNQFSVIAGLGGQNMNLWRAFTAKA